MQNKYGIENFSSALAILEKTLLGILFAAMLALLIIQVACRYYLQLPLGWAEELIRYLFIACSYLGASIAIKERSHIEVNILPAILKVFMKPKAGKEEKINKILWCSDMFNLVVGTLFWVFLSFQFYYYILDMIEFDQHSVALNIPMSYLIGFVCVSSCLCTFHYLTNTIYTVRHKTIIASKEEEELSRI